MIDFKDAVLDALVSVLAATAGAPDRESLGKTLTHPPDPTKGDLAFPVFLLAKALKRTTPGKEMVLQLRKAKLLERKPLTAPAFK